MRRDVDEDEKKRKSGGDVNKAGDQADDQNCWGKFEGWGRGLWQGVAGSEVRATQ